MHRIAVLVPTTFDYMRLIVAGIRAESFTWNDFEWLFFLEKTPPNPMVLKKWGASGIIGSFSGAMADSFLPLGIPIVNVSTKAQAKPICNIMVDNYAMGQLAAGHLMEKQPVSYGIAVQDGRSFSDMRKKGFIEYLHQHGLDCSILDMPQSFVDWLDALERWIQTFDCPAAIFAVNDDLARLTLSAACAAQRIVPDDLTIMGANNETTICINARPALSSIHARGQQVGKLAARALHQAVTDPGRPPQDIVIPPGDVIRRGSTALGNAAKDPLVRRAIAVMRDNLAEGFDINTVAGMLGVSVKTIETHFSNELGRTPLKVLHELRLDEAKRLIVNVKLPIAAIAQCVGFRTPSHFGAFFKKATGITPATYRKRHQD